MKEVVDPTGLLMELNKLSKLQMNKRKISLSASKAKNNLG
jgi:hypothetical protein